jgi:hypothetical protein
MGRSCAEIQAEIAEVRQLKAIVTQKLHAKTRRMQELFRHFDANRDGRITHDEISNTLERMHFCFNENQTAAVTRWIDEDNTGSVQFHDFAKNFDGHDRHETAAPAPYLHHRFKGNQQQESADLNLDDHLDPIPCHWGTHKGRVKAQQEEQEEQAQQDRLQHQQQHSRRNFPNPLLCIAVMLTRSPTCVAGTITL